MSEIQINEDEKINNIHNLTTQLIFNYIQKSEKIILNMEKHVSKDFIVEMLC